MGGRDIFRADLDAVKNGFTTPYALLVIYPFYDFFISAIP
jgi:hypothetical protein